MPILTKRKLRVAGGDMVSLHDAVLTIEERRLREKDQAYDVFVAKVPLRMGFVEKSPADLLFVRFSDIFDIFHLFRPQHSLVRLFSLDMAMRIHRNNTLDIAIVDPYYMRDSHVAEPGDQRIASEYLTTFMLANMNKMYCLMPFFSE